MKKFLAFGLMVFFLTGVASAQVTDQAFNKTGKDNPIQVKKIYWPAEDDKVPILLSDANDTSSEYYFPDFREMWMVCKPFDATGQDSTDAYVILQVKAGDLTNAAGNSGIGWVHVDSTKIVTADSIGGHWDEWEICPPAEKYRVVVDAVAGNDVNTGVQYPVWVIFKQ
jgi:hypothetical protein